MATHDALTGLPNRALLKERLTRAIQLAERHDRWATVAFVDLDNFKYVNDSLGHNAGDELLKSIAGRMVAALRATDTVVRIGGDEFVVIFSDQSRDATGVIATVRKLQSAIAETVEISGRQLSVTSSVGAATYPADGQDADALLVNADAAMYRAKEVGRDNFQFYRPEFNAQIPRAVSPAGGVARRDRGRRVRPALPAAGQPAHARRVRGRSAHPLESPKARAASPGALHSARRRDRTDRADRRMGASTRPAARRGNGGTAACRRSG